MDIFKLKLQDGQAKFKICEHPRLDLEEPANPLSAQQPYALLPATIESPHDFVVVEAEESSLDFVVRVDDQQPVFVNSLAYAGMSIQELQPGSCFP